MKALHGLYFILALVSGLATTQISYAPEAQAQEHAPEGNKEDRHTKEAPVKDAHSPSRPKADPRVHMMLSGQRTNCVVDEDAIEDLKKAREEVEAKKKELASKENELKNREQALDEEIKRLGKARDELKAAQDIKKNLDEEKLGRLVETLLNMSPKTAAKLLATVDENLAVAAAYRMDTVKLGKILNVMEVGTSSKLTELMVGVMKANQKNEKGGKGDDQNHEQPARNGSGASQSGKSK